MKRNECLISLSFEGHFKTISDNQHHRDYFYALPLILLSTRVEVFSKREILPQTYD